MRSERDLAALLKRNKLDLTQYAAGQGGSAVIHRARLLDANPEMGASPGFEVAIKEYKDDVVAKPEQLDRIKQEGALATLRHPNVVRIHALLYAGDETPPLLIMDWVDGMPLDRWCGKGNAKRTWEEVRRVATSLVDGVSALHQQKIMHRDIKPANVLVAENGEPILMDMGVVELAADDEHTMHTSVRDFIGSVRYAAPQFIRGEPFAFADDVYSIGATLYLVVTGAEVFAKVERKPLLPYYILTEQPRVGEISGGLPPQLSVLIEGALHRDRKRRPTLKELGDALQTPEIAPYIQRELDARNDEERGFVVIAVHDQGATVLADLRNTEPNRTSSYAVVRFLKPVRVPSLGGDSKPEKWIADVVLKHFHNGIAHFAVQGKRWREGTPSASEAMGVTTSVLIRGTPGGWIEYDKQTDAVQVGDVVVVQS